MKELWGGGFVSFHPVSCLITHQMCVCVCVWCHNVTAFVWKYHERNEQFKRDARKKRLWECEGIRITFNVPTLQNCTPRSEIPCGGLTPTVSVLAAGHGANPALGIFADVLLMLMRNFFGSVWQRCSSLMTAEHHWIGKCFKSDRAGEVISVVFFSFVLSNSLLSGFFFFRRSGGRSRFAV